jgi:hypothetical protein
LLVNESSWCTEALKILSLSECDDVFEQDQFNEYAGLNNSVASHFESIQTLTIEAEYFDVNSREYEYELQIFALIVNVNEKKAFFVAAAESRKQVRDAVFNINEAFDFIRCELILRLQITNEHVLWGIKIEMTKRIFNLEREMKL